MLVESLRLHARQRPDQRAFTFLAQGEEETATLTWSALWAAATSAAKSISEHAAPGDRALLAFPSGLPLIVGFLGCVMARVTPVTTSLPRLPNEVDRTAQIIADCQPRVVLVEDESDFSFDFSLPQLVIGCRPPENHFEPLPQSPDDLALLQYTSGSTRTPRGVMVSNANLTANLRMYAQARAVSVEDTFVNWCPLFHDLGLIGYVAFPVFCGAHTVFMPPKAFLHRPIRWLNTVSRYRGTATSAPNFAYDLISDHAPKKEQDRAKLDLASLRLISNASEPIRPETVQRFAGTYAPMGLRRSAIAFTYGLAEATLLVSSNPLNSGPVIRSFGKAGLSQGNCSPAADSDRDSTPLPSVGQSLGGEIAIVDPHAFVRLPDGRIGEIWINGPHVTCGYWNRAEETKSTFAARISGETENWLRTGDLGFRHEGRLFISGRLKETIIVRGRNFYPQDIEYAIRQSSPELRRRGCVAFAILGRRSENLVVVQELQTGHVPRAEALARRMRRAVTTTFGIDVSHLWFVKAGTIRRTTSGKVMRVACRSSYLRGELDYAVVARFDKTSDQPTVSLPKLSATPSVTEIKDWLARWLGVPAIDANDSVLDWGLDSLGLVSLMNDLDAALGRRINGNHWAPHPSAARLFSQIDERDAASKAITDLEATGPEKLSARQRLHPHLVKNGPTFRGTALLGPKLGQQILRSLVSIREVRELMVPGREKALRECLRTAGIPELAWEQSIRSNFLVNTWVNWRRHPRVLDRTTIQIIGEIPPGPTIFAVPHTPLRWVAGSILFPHTKEHAIIGFLNPELVRDQGMGEFLEAELSVGGKSQDDPRALHAAEFRHAVDVLGRGGIAIIAGDNDAGTGGFTYAFYGRKRAMRPGMLTLAKATGKAVVPLFPELTENGTIRIQVLPALKEATMLTDYAQLLRDRWPRDLPQWQGYMVDKFLALPREDKAARHSS